MNARPHLGPFLLGPKIGSGGMATIHIGWDTREAAAGAVVALKRLKDEFHDKSEYVEMFLDEARIVARLSHPHIIRVVEFSDSQDGAFIAMELLSGRSLADVFDVLAQREERIPWQLGAWVCARIAEGLHHAHEITDGAGRSYELVHRDVNPSNIFLTIGGEVKLLDFGLARAAGQDAGAAPGKIKGKLAYLSPEQFKSRPVDRRTDIFQLGITLWEVATGARLFRRDSQVETLRAIQDGKIPNPRELDPDLPEACSRIIMRALERDPDRRYTTARAFHRALDAVITPMPKPQSLASFLESVFPGENQRHRTWLADVTAVDAPLRMNTLSPPAPVPTETRITMPKSER